MLIKLKKSQELHHRIVERERVESETVIIGLDREILKPTTKKPTLKL